MAVLGIGLIVGGAQPGLGQYDPRPRAGSVDLRALAHELEERVQHLGEDIAADLERTPAGRHLLQDTHALAEEVEAFHATLHGGRIDWNRAWQAYSRIDTAWHHLKSGLARPGVSSPAVDRAVRRVDEVDAQLHQALGLDVPGNLRQLAHEMAERVQHLGEDIAADLERTPAGRHLLQDTRELAEAVDEFHGTLHDSPDLYRARQSFAGADGAWHHLREGLARPGVSSPAVDRAVRRVDEVDYQLHQALGLRVYATSYEEPRPVVAVPPPPPEPAPVRVLPPPEPVPAPLPPGFAGFAEVQRLGYALDDRSEALLESLRAEMAALPEGPALIQDARGLARACDEFPNRLRSDQDVQALQSSFQAVAAIADRLEGRLQAAPCPPRVQQAWQSFAAAETLLRQQLHLPTPPPQVRVVLRPAPNAPSPLVGLADQLVAETEAFIQVFGPTAGIVPQGRDTLADAQRLRAAAADFREGVARGIDPGRLARQFAEADATAQRMARRSDRIARGRTGPNIQQIQKLNDIVGQIRQLLALPGYPPLVRPDYDD